MKLNRRDCKIIAHRGLSSKAPENTLAAFKLASIDDYDGIECDIRVTKDHQFVVFHDETLDRMTNGSGLISQTSSKMLKHITINSGSKWSKHNPQSIPYLYEYLEICVHYQKIPFIEIKEVLDLHDLDRLVSLLKEYNLIEQAYLMAFNLDYLFYLRNSYPQLKLQYLTYLITDQVIDICHNYQYDVGVYYRHLAKTQINECHQHNILVSVWTVDRYKTANRLIQEGIDFLTTNRLK